MGKPESIMSDFTIITSFFRDSGHLIRNMKTVRRFNPNSDYEWILIDNSSGGEDFNTIKDEKFIIYKGIEEKYIQPFFLKKVSAANAISLNFGITKTNTRFICVMDPDFFIVYPNWIDAVLSYMDEAAIGILSAPYHPMWYEKAHRATGHFMVIDTDFVPKALLDFTPALDDFDPNNKERPKWMGKRRNLRRFNDCGSQIENRFGNEMEYLVPLVDVGPNLKISKFDKTTDKFLPKKWRLTHIDYPVVSARVSGILAAAEGYYWRGSLFAIHLRRYGQSLMGRDPRKTDDKVDEVLNQIYAGYRNILEAK